MNSKTSELAVRETAVASMADICSQNGMWEKICAMGKTLQQSKMLGDNVTEAGAVAATMTMVSEGLNPVEFKRRYHIIGNTPSRTTGSLLGDFQQMGGTWKIIQSDDEACEIEFKLGEMTYKSRVEMDRMLKTTVPYGKDGQIKANWANFPDDMLWARCCSKGLNRIAPSIKGGIYTREEVMDFDQPEQDARRADVSENEMRYRAAMQKGPQANPAPAAPEKHEEPVKAEVVEDAEVVKLKPSDVLGVTVCPIEGKFFGVPFCDIPVDMLQFMVAPECIEKHPEITEKHVECINCIIDNIIAESEDAE